MIKVTHLTKKYNRKTLANDDINLEIKDGEVTVLLGPNGAGKSTLIKSICGLLRFEGNITVDGFDNHSLDAKRILGYIPEMPAPYPLLTAWEHCEFIARAYKLTDWEPYAEELLKRFELDDKKDKLGKELSKGMQQKISVVCAVLPRPKAAIFDEPLVGLDPHAIREIKNILLELKNSGCAVLISTHMIESTAEIWDTTHIMMKGKVAATVHRSDTSGESLEDLFFRITEGDSAGSEPSDGEVN